MFASIFIEFFFICSAIYRWTDFIELDERDGDYQTKRLVHKGTRYQFFFWLGSYAFLTIRTALICQTLGQTALQPGTIALCNFHSIWWELLEFYLIDPKLFSFIKLILGILSSVYCLCIVWMTEQHWNSIVWITHIMGKCLTFGHPFRSASLDPIEDLDVARSFINTENSKFKSILFILTKARRKHTNTHKTN